jgi:hypothetical protein
MQRLKVWSGFDPIRTRCEDSKRAGTRIFCLIQLKGNGILMREAMIFPVDSPIARTRPQLITGSELEGQSGQRGSRRSSVARREHR